MQYALVAAGMIICAFFALRTERLLVSALWLAGTSALVAMMMYLLGAHEIAVIELSVGAGLVTVLFVFAINIAGEEAIPSQSAIPFPLAIILVCAAIGGLAWMAFPNLVSMLPGTTPSKALSLNQQLWDNRQMDVMLQIALIFAGVMGVVGLLSDDKAKEHHS